MSHKIQISVDESLNKMVQEGARSMGLSVSSYVRSILVNTFSKNPSLMEASMEDLRNGRVETLTFDEFKKSLRA
jgi:hypothetical protein